MRIFENLPGEGLAGRRELRFRLPSRKTFGPGAAGFTLLEIMIAMVVLVTVVTGAMYALMGSLQANRLTMMQILASSAIRAQTDEVYSVGINDKYKMGDLAPAIISAYVNEYEGQTLSRGLDAKNRIELRDNTLIYHFPVRRERAVSRMSDAAAISRDILGEMVIYLDEAEVPPSEGADTIWHDLGQNAGASLERGFDMNRDGVITPLAVVPSIEDLRDPRGMGILQVPIDITVTVYDQTGKQVIYSLTRRIVATEIKGGASTKLEGETESEEDGMEV
ncbi:MAG: type II secretion system GspH family protein [Planctomycetota bacterium]|jgi:prepilin-type N-terminal cleavage/methylation domain-containing protein|nr:type II secretion system GspH family protein [Planctomycetota bacterium]